MGANPISIVQYNSFGLSTHTNNTPNQPIGIMDKSPPDSTARDFSNVKLKPAPLRLTRKSFTGSDKSHHSPSGSPSKHAQGHETPTLGSRRHGSPRPQGPQGFHFLELTPQVSRAPAPGLAGLVSKFEILDAVNSVDAKDLEHPLSPVKPTSPTKLPKPSRARPRTDPRLLFTEGSPFGRSSRADLPNSDTRDLSDDELLSPRTPTPRLPFSWHDQEQIGAVED